MILLLLLLILPLSILFLFHRPRSRSPPGPRGLPLVGNLHQFDTSTPHIYLHHLSKRYGPLISLTLGSVPVLVVSSPDTAREVLKTNDLVFCSRPKSLGQHKLTYNGLDVAFAPYSDAWRELRKICVVHLLSNKQVHSFRPTREEEVSSMIRKLYDTANLKQAAPLSTIMMSLTSSLICRVAFGKTLGEEDSRRMRFDELMIESQAMQGGFFVSDYMPWFGWVDRLSGMIGRLDRVYEELDEFYQETIDEHLRPLDSNSGGPGSSTNPNILDLLIQLKEDKAACSIQLTWDHIKAILMNIFIAGTDTGAATIIWSMTALMKAPTAMKKAQNEVREVVGKKGSVNEDDLPKLPFLKAVIKEALRLYPPAPLLLPRQTLQQCTIRGYTIPAKTLVFVNAWAIARDPASWDAPNEFRPERFLHTSVDIVGKDFEVIPFGAGRRGCPGISMGLATVELALANLLYCFDWEMPSGMKAEDIDTQVLPGITMHKKDPLCLVPIINTPSISE